MSGNTTHDYNGNKIKEVLSLKDIAFIDSKLLEDFEVKPGSKQAKFVVRYMTAMYRMDEKSYIAFMDSVERLGVPLISLFPPKKTHPPTAAQIISRAIVQNNIAPIDSILKRGVSVDSVISFSAKGNPSERLSILSAAASENKVSIMEFLLRKGANIHKPDHNKKTPICFVKSAEAFDLLFAHGASLGKIDYWEHKKRNIYPSEYLYNKKEITDLILDKAPAILFKDFEFYDLMLYSFVRNSDSTSIKKLLQRGAPLNKPDKPGGYSSIMEEGQPLFYAESPAMFRFLINNGSTLKNLNSHGVDAHYKTFGWGDIGLVEWVEAKGLPIQKPNNPYFVFQKDIAFIRYLLNRGISINSTDNYGNTALIRAKHFDNNPALVDFLLENGADKNILNKKGGSFYNGRIAKDR
ncbi:ankyrin repeat domain-containing protein [Rufibacter sediminis]|uniref:Ankyrin repeat domain-containing protein n=1 Tax=Rufibacter sediminis TaxID=2762756 RepID=A0ABR6VQ35_9BACT|nr:ankyrin repeat domain-containing protein [Rufibacter sediminis]MBC3538989.1 ankyrin repeat domain-containing protein [Rufibacter sediminis]